MRAEYFRLSEKGLADAELLAKLRESYQVMVNRTDPLQKHRGDKVAKEWDCPKVNTSSRAQARLINGNTLQVLIDFVLNRVAPQYFHTHSASMVLV